MMNTLQIIKRSFMVACAVLTIGVATIQTASASVLNDNPIERPIAGDGQETHGGKG